MYFHHLLGLECAGGLAVFEIRSFIALSFQACRGRQEEDLPAPTASGLHVTRLPSGREEHPEAL